MKVATLLLAAIAAMLPAYALAAPPAGDLETRISTLRQEERNLQERIGGLNQQLQQVQQRLLALLEERDRIRAATAPVATGAAPVSGTVAGEDGPWFCCQWVDPVLKATTCGPMKNRAACLRDHQGEVHEGQACSTDTGTCTR